MKDRTIKILDKLLSIDYPVTIEYLSQEFSVSRRTIHSEIIEINDYLLTQNLTPILSIRNKGILLNLEQEIKIQLKNKTNEIKRSSFLNPEERTFDLLLDIAFGLNPVILRRKESQYFISKSTLDEDVRRLKNALHRYNIEITSVPQQGLILVGSERTIRIMLHDIINRSIGYIEFNELEAINSYQQILYRYLYKAICDIKKLLNDTITKESDNIYKSQIVIFTAIWLKRNLQNKSLTNTSKTITQSTEQIDSHITQFIHNITRHYSTNFSALEINYICLMLDTFNSNGISNSIQWVQSQLLSIKLIQFVEKSTGFSFQHNEKLHEVLCNHLAGLIARIKNDINIINPLIESIKQNYSTLFKVIKNFISQLEKEINKPISDDEVAFLTIHFSASISVINQNCDYYYNAAVFCDHGIATSNLLAEKLKELFNINVVITLSKKDISLINEIDVDIIFSTFPINNPSKPTLILPPIINNETMLIISEFLKKNEDLIHKTNPNIDPTDLFLLLINLIKDSGGVASAPICSKLENVLNKFNLKINKRKIQPMLKDILVDSNIRLNLNCVAWQDAIDETAKPLLKDKSINQSYIDAMLQSVEIYGPYIVIGKHLALAHARPEDGVNKLSISVATMKQPIDFGNQDMGPVKIIFCLAAIDSYSHLNIMRSLIELINDEHELERLINSKSIDEFKLILFKNEEIR